MAGTGGMAGTKGMGGGARRCLPAALLALGVWAGSLVLPQGLTAAAFLLGQRTEVEAAAYALSQRRAEDFRSAIGHALAAGDSDLAASLVDLARQRGLRLPEEVESRVKAAEEAVAARAGSEAWNGFLTGDAPSVAALAGALAADVSGAGDVRDLYRQASRYLGGEEVDPLVIGLAAVGLGLTAVTVASLGGSAPAKAGVSTLKVLKRAGKLSPALAREAGAVAARALDGEALRLVGSSMARLDLATARAASERVLRPEAMRTLAALGEDVTGIARNAGYRAATDTLATASSAAEVGAVARISARFGKATRAVLVMCGGVLTFASYAAEAAMWSLWLILWIAGVLIGAARMGRKIGRRIWPSPDPRPRVPTTTMLT